MTKTDSQLKQDIETELRWEPRINAAQIGVSVDQGAVSLTGAVDTYVEKWAAEDAIKRVAGVRAVAEDLTVKLQGRHKHSDAEIAQAALSIFGWNVEIPEEVTVKVQQGQVTLEGQVAWNYQRDAAEHSIRNLIGVVSVVNAITIKAVASATQVKESIQAALQRQATTDANSIEIDTAGGTVTLSGKASTWHAIEDAARAAWAAPGVTQVLDNIHMGGY